MINYSNNKKVGNALKWSTISEVSTRLISPIINMILARLLAPDAFGLVATITMVVTFAEVFTDAGFQKYIVQHEFVDEEDLNTSTNVAFWTNLIFSIIIFFLIGIFSTPIANLVGSAGEEKAIIISSISIPLVSFSSIQMARYRRSFSFKSLFIARIVTSIIPIFITVPLSILFKNHWALIIGTLFKDFSNAILLTIMSNWKPNFSYNFNKLKKMLSFSIWSMLEHIAIWLTANIDIFIVGRLLNKYYLGLYKTSMTTVNSYMSIITAATMPVLFAALSRSQNNEDVFKSTYYKFQRLVSILVMPMGVGLFLYSELATKILLGSNWMEASGFIGLWALTSSVTIVFGHFNGEVYRSKGKPKLSLFSQLIHLVFLVLIVYTTSSLGFKSLYIARSLIRLQAIITGLIILSKIFRISTISIIKNVFPSVFSALLMGILGYFLQMVSSSFIWSIMSIFICALFYFSILLNFKTIRYEIFSIPIIKKIICKIKN